MDVAIVVVDVPVTCVPGTVVVSALSKVSGVLFYEQETTDA